MSDLNNIYTLRYKGVQEKLTGKNKRLYFTLENAKNAIYSLAGRNAREHFNGHWKLLTTHEKRSLANKEVANFSIITYSPTAIFNLKEEFLNG